MITHKLYMATTSDRYELPLYVADTPKELARQMGITKGAVLSGISHAKQYKTRSAYHRIEYTDKEWEE